MGRQWLRKHRETGNRGLFMEIEGKQRVVLSGCQGIAGYTEDCVSLYTPVGTVTVYGSQLEMGCMTVDGASLFGCIERIEFDQ